MARLHIGRIEMQLNRKAIKHLHVSVLPPDGRVRVSAPESMTDTAIRMAVISRMPWIKRQIRDFQDQPRQSPREMVTGESHYLWGRNYRLNVEEGFSRHEVRVGGGRIQLYVKTGTTADSRARLLTEYYRQVLKLRIADLLKYWQTRIDLRPEAWGVMRMKTRWGSCNTERKRILLNLELAKKPPECLEYILVHELVHLLERNHNERFRSLMDRYLPDWRERRDLLNRMPLAHDLWAY